MHFTNTFMNELTGCLKIKHFNMNVIVLIYFITHVKSTKFLRFHILCISCLYPFRITNITRTVVRVDVYFGTCLCFTDTIKLSHQYITRSIPLYKIEELTLELMFFFELIKLVGEKR